MRAKRLYKTDKNSMVSGVCQGIAEYFDMDPSIVRLIFALSLLFAGTGLLVYIILALILPDKSEVVVRKQDDDEIYDRYDDY